MKEYLNTLVGKYIKVDRGGPESRSGLLLDVQNNYFALLTREDGVVYYNLQHIKSFTRDPKKDHETSAIKLPKTFTYFKGESFKDVLSKLVFTWVVINRGGPERVEGVLISVDNTGISLVLKDEVVNVSDFHIRNVSYGNNPFPKEKGENQNKSEQNKSDQSKNDQSKNEENKNQQNKDEQNKDN